MCKHDGNRRQREVRACDDARRIGSKNYTFGTITQMSPDRLKAKITRETIEVPFRFRVQGRIQNNSDARAWLAIKPYLSTPTTPPPTHQACALFNNNTPSRPAPLALYYSSRVSYNTLADLH